MTFSVQIISTVFINNVMLQTEILHVSMWHTEDGVPLHMDTCVCRSKSLYIAV